MLVLLVQHLHQLREEDLHGLAVAVRLEEAEEGGAEVVDAGDEGEPRTDSDLLLSGATSSRLPAAPLVPHRVQPALVQCDPPPLATAELQEGEGALLSLNEAAPAVGLRCEADDPPVAQAHLLLHDLANLVLLQLLLRCGLVVVPHLLDGAELDAGLHLQLDEVGELLHLQLLLRPLRDQLPQQLWLLADLGDEGGDGSLGVAVLLGQVLLGLAIDEDAVDDLELLIEGEWPRLPPPAPQARWRLLREQCLPSPQGPLPLALLPFWRD